MFLDILEELERTSSTKQKESILSRNKDNDQLKYYCKVALDIEITLGIKKFDIPEAIEESTPFVYDRFVYLVDDLKSRSLTGNSASRAVTSFLSECNKLEQKWYIKCLQKDLSSIGIGARLINKIWNNLCLDFKVMLAEPDDKLDKFDWSQNEAYIELKLNGVRTLTKISDGNVNWIKGRSGLDIENFSFIKESIDKLGISDNIVLDGEVHCNNSLEDTMSVFGFDFKKTKEDFKTKKAYDKYLLEKQEKEILLNNCTYTVFDIIKEEEWTSQTGIVKYPNRRIYLENLLLPLRENEIENVKIVKSTLVESLSEAIDYSKNVIESGLEGCILKTSSHLYEFKRSKNWIKLKEIVEVDALVLDLIKSKTKFSGDGAEKAPMVGALLVRDQNGRVFEVGTGKLLTEENRILFWNNPDLIKNKIVFITAQRFTDTSAICPRIEYIRVDKTSP